MIRKLKNEDINKVMDIWEESTIKAHDFIDKDYWKNNYDTVKMYTYLFQTPLSMMMEKI